MNFKLVLDCGMSWETVDKQMTTAPLKNSMVMNQLEWLSCSLNRSVLIWRHQKYQHSGARYYTFLLKITTITLWMTWIILYTLSSIWQHHYNNEKKYKKSCRAKTFYVLSISRRINFSWWKTIFFNMKLISQTEDCNE